MDERDCKKEEALKEKDPYKKLKLIACVLMSDDGCPWDRVQTHESIKKYLIEEAYEVIEAIEKKDFQGLKEELGDLLYQIFFHSEMARREGKFDVDDVFLGIAEKLIRRHPHVFGDLAVKDEDEVLKNWEKIKNAEKKRKSLLDGLPMSLPALFLAYRIQEKTSRVGFDWKDAFSVFSKIKEEIEEFENALKSGDENRVKEEFGDFIFSIVNLGRHLGIDSEEALRNTVKKFKNRFQYIEDKASELGRDVRDLTLEEMDSLWEDAKKRYK